MAYWNLWLRKYRIQITLLLTLVLILLIPFVEVLRLHPLKFSLALLLLLALFAWRYKAKIDVFLTLFLAVSLIAVKFYWRESEEYVLLFRSAAILSFLLFTFTLCIGPWSRFSSWFLNFYKHRRHFGVTTFLLGFTHGAMIFFQPYFGSYNPADAFQLIFVFYGFTALFIMSLLAITSWDYVQKHVSLSWWKLIHVALFLVYGGIVYYFYKVSGGQFTFGHKAVLIFFLIFWLLVAPYSLASKILYKVNGWKQLHVLIYIAYASVVIHISAGALRGQAVWLRAVFWTLVAVVVFWHLAGWIFMLKQFLTRRKIQDVYIELEGKKYYLLDRVDAFFEAKGRRFDIAGNPIAAYKFKDKIFAVSNVCSHQGGPIYLGRIRNGYIECPWHRWQFSVSDGCGPPGYPDCIPYFPVTVRDGLAYVLLEPIAKPPRKIEEEKRGIKHP